MNRRQFDRYWAIARQTGLAARFALRELRGGVRGFAVFLACIAIGVAAISGVRSVGAAMTQAIAAQGRTILGGDVAIAVSQQWPDDAGMAFLKSQGEVSSSVLLRAMARRTDGETQALVEIRAAGPLYPLFGAVEGDAGPIRIGDAAADEVFADAVLLDRLSLKAGDKLAIGNAVYRIAGAIRSEPDRIGESFAFEPRVLMGLGGLDAAGLIQPGSLYRTAHAVRLADPTPGGVERFLEAAKTRFGDAGWRVRDHNNAAPALSRNIARFSQFLALVGLSALIVGGVGVANSVAAFVSTKRATIATMKSLGGVGGFVFGVYFLQILILAAAGIAAGLIAGAVAPVAVAGFLRDFLPISGAATIYPGALGDGALFGLLVAILFSVRPLAAAHDLPAASLFRSSGLASRQWPRPVYLAIMAVCALVLGALVTFGSGNRFVSAVFLAAVAAAFLVLYATGAGLQKLAAIAPRPRDAALRLALGNLSRPGSLARPVTLSLGLGLALIVTLALIDASLARQIRESLPARAPDFFFLDIPKSRFPAFAQKLAELAPGGEIVSAPMLRGRIVALKGIAADSYAVPEGGAWVLRGDRGVTYAAELPKNATLAAGEWWPADYGGAPLVSFSAEEAAELGLGLGDTIEVSVLGRRIAARIANLRRVEWESFGINFVMVFSPNAFAGAPHSMLATLATGATGGEGGLLREVTKAFPSVSAIAVREALERVNAVVRQLGTAIRAASAVALVASALVLAGALAAGAATRNRDAAVLKTLGATRPFLMRMLLAEFAALGLATAIFALGAGAAAAFLVTTRIMGVDFHFDWAVAAGAVALALAVTVGIGLAGTLRMLGRKAAPELREV